MAYVTLDVLADAGGDITPSARASTITYNDGYEQVVYSGRQRIHDTINFTYSREREHTQTVYDVLLASIRENAPFYYRFAATDAAKLYKAKFDTLTHKHVGGLKWSVTATLVEWNGLK